MMQMAAAVTSGNIRSIGPTRSTFECVLTNLLPGFDAAINLCTFGRNLTESSKLFPINVPPTAILNHSGRTSVVVIVDKLLIDTFSK